MKRLLFALAVFVGNYALAQAKTPPGKPAQQEINFEDDTIEGDLSKPDGEYIEARKTVKHSNLIKIRESFKEKVVQSVGEL